MRTMASSLSASIATPRRKSLRRLLRRGVAMDADKELAMVLICDRAASIEFDKPVVFSRINHLYARQLLFDQLAKLEHDPEGALLFHVAVRADRAGIFAAMPRIEHDDVELGFVCNLSLRWRKDEKDTKDKKERQ